MEKRLLRSEVPVEQTSNLADIYPSRADLEADLAVAVGAVPKLAAFRGRLGESAQVLVECLEEDDRQSRRLSHATSYAFNQLSADLTNTDSQALYGRVTAASSQWMSARAFIRPELLQLPAGTIERYLAEEPRLLIWRRLLERTVELGSHQLSAASEQALAALSGVFDLPHEAYGRWRATDLAFSPIVDGEGQARQMSFAAYERDYERSWDTVLRRNAYRTFVDGLRPYMNTVASLWATQARYHAIMARLRGYPSAIEMLLGEQEVPVEVHNRLLDVILTELAPHMRRLAGLRRRVLGLDRVLYCDIEAQLDPGFNPFSSFADASAMIKSSLSVLGDEYAGIINRAFDERWIDWANNEGKQSDCYSGGADPHPYVLIGWDNTMRSALILAHELGHAAHQYLGFHGQQGANRGHALLLGESASTTNEAIVGHQLMARAVDGRTRRWVIMQLLTSYYHNMVRHLIEAELQRRLYPVADEGQPITAELLNRVQGDILSEFWGDAVEIDDGARMTWMRQVHYYAWTLYSYTYSGGLTIGTAVARAIEREGRPAAERWVNTLKAGNSQKPLALAKMAGVDLARPEAIRDAVAFVGELIDELCRLF